MPSLLNPTRTLWPVPSLMVLYVSMTVGSKRSRALWQCSSATLDHAWIWLGTLPMSISWLQLQWRMLEGHPMRRVANNGTYAGEYCQDGAFVTVANLTVCDSPKIPLFRLPKTPLAEQTDESAVDDDERMLAVAWSKGQVAFGGASGQLYTCNL
eukprot:m.211818 g.211818  ORF g.211818 m.211818 type:complete len:154 (-) comp17157_c1_seq5:60-521(-)